MRRNESEQSSRSVVTHETLAQPWTTQTGTGFVMQLWRLVSGLLLGGIMTANAVAQEGYESRRFRPDPAGPALNYLWLMPAGFNPSGTEKYPLVVFLHGAGERGDGDDKPLVHCVKRFLEPEIRAKYPCFVLVPQCPNEKRWVEVDWGADRHDYNPEPSVTVGLVSQLLDSLPPLLRIDQQRIYLAGLSMGGFGTWDMATRNPERFAAIVPICGGGDEAQAKRLAPLPIWAFHGAKDVVVKPERSRRMIAAIREAGGQPKYTEYPDVDHNSWTPAFADPELFPWLFAQRRK